MSSLDQIEDVRGEHDLVVVGHLLDAGHDLGIAELGLGRDAGPDLVDGDLLNVLLLENGEKRRLEFCQLLFRHSHSTSGFSGRGCDVTSGGVSVRLQPLGFSFDGSFLRFRFCFRFLRLHVFVFRLVFLVVLLLVVGSGVASFLLALKNAFEVGELKENCDNTPRLI